MSKMNDRDQKFMAKDLRNDVLCRCWTPCPFQVITEYLRDIPDPYDVETDKERLVDARVHPLPFLELCILLVVSSI
jgi:hypothetical protein